MILETERLILRELSIEDAQHFYDLNTDPLVIRYTGDAAFENVEAAKSFLENYEQYKKYGYGRWATILKSTGEWIGWCGLKYEIQIAETDLGYRFFRKHWGKGYATESAEASLKYGLEHLGLKRIIGRSFKENLPSIKVLQKIGMVYEKDLMLDGVHPGVLYVSEK